MTDTDIWSLMISGQHCSMLITSTGRIAALLELGSGFNPEFTGRENVYMNAAILGLSLQKLTRDTMKSLLLPILVILLINP